MEQHTVLIISENKTDHLILSACLERALPTRFHLASSETIERPLEALTDPMIDAVIMAHGPETEYLLLGRNSIVTAPMQSKEGHYCHNRIEMLEELARAIPAGWAFDPNQESVLSPDVVEKVVPPGVASDLAATKATSWSRSNVGWTL